MLCWPFFLEFFSRHSCSSAHFPLFVCSLFMFLFSNFFTLVCVYRFTSNSSHFFLSLSSKLITAPFFANNQRFQMKKKNCIYLIAYTSIKIKPKKTITIQLEWMLELYTVKPLNDIIISHSALTHTIHFARISFLLLFFYDLLLFMTFDDTKRRLNTNV